MNEKIKLDGTWILAVDDEPEVLQTLEEILGMGQVHTAVSYEKALELLEKNDHDAAVLDIMCTRGGSGLISSLAGGAAERVFRQASCPVFSVKPKEAESTQL